MGFKEASNLTKGQILQRGICQRHARTNQIRKLPVNFQHKGQNAVKGIKEDFVQYGPQMF